MKSIVKSAKISICLMHFLFRMVKNKAMLYCHCFSTLLYNMLRRRSYKIRRDWNSMEHISCWFMLIGP